MNTIVGSGISVSNPIYTGSPQASGTFTGGNASGLGFESGIIMTTGLASDADGPNSNGNAGETLGGGGQFDDTSTDLELAGDIDLSVLAGNLSTSDASILEFDFTTSASGDLFFNFVFASEEYIDWVDTAFNDVFGFYVDGTNIGLVPGTTDPITVNTVNPTTNSAFYVDNIDPGVHDIEYDGFTTVITASIVGLAADEIHSMKFAIADASDAILDAAVFIQAGSFSDEPVDDPGETVPEPGAMVLLGTGLIGLFGTSRRISKS